MRKLLPSRVRRRARLVMSVLLRTDAYREWSPV